MTKADSLESVGKIAVVGMACRVPGARSSDEFWKNLCDGRETITFFSDEEMLEQGIDPALLKVPGFVRAGGVYDGTFMFDASFFGYTPREGEVLDPQHRIFLECAWEALEKAGCDPGRYQGRIGVFGGAGAAYHFFGLVNDPAVANSVGMMAVFTSNDKDYLATRVGYKLNLRGPCITVQTACSTSLVAIVLGCQSLLNYQSDVVLAGGITLRPSERGGYFYSEGGIVSPDGHCRTFDASAKGTIFSSGAGIVVLKRLKDALADGDTIHAVVIGSGMNNDGSAKIGFTAPSLEGQFAVSSDAIAMAGINPETIGYVECHGTATPLGDPIEIAALTRTFRAHTQKNGFCAVGSVKSNLGHTDAAAGVTGFIKTVLSLEHKKIPPTLHFVKANPEIDFANSPFYVNTSLMEWKRDGAPRRAALNSFGIGGTNAHVILEEAQPVERSRSLRRWQLLVWSAKTASALDTMTANLAGYLKEHGDVLLADVAYTLQVGRAVFPHRRILVCRDHTDALLALDSHEPPGLLTKVKDKAGTPVAFLFPGQGSQYINMGKELYDSDRVFRAELDRCAQLATPYLGYDIREVLYTAEQQTEPATQRLEQTINTQPALFVTEYALARMWMKWGIQPDAMIGHSIGEYVAACLAGVFSVDEALQLVSARGRLMQELPHGAMLSVALSERETGSLLSRMDGLSLAAINGATSCVVTGPAVEISRLEGELGEKGVTCRRLHTSHAFHSSMMDPILEPFRKLVENVRLQAPKIPYISNLTGDWITARQATDPEYWVKHLRHTVRFTDGVELLLKGPGKVLLEVGPGRTLTSLVGRHRGKSPDLQVFPSLPNRQTDRESELQFLFTTLGKLWLEGVSLNWQEFYAEEKRGRIPLPTYPFERELYQVSVSNTRRAAADDAHQPQLLEKKKDLAEWFYHPSWKRSAPLQPQPLPPGEGDSWLLFLDECGVGSAIEERLKKQGQDVISVTPGKQFRQDGERSFVIDPGSRDHYVTLAAELKRSDRKPAQVVHLWGVAQNDHGRKEIECVDEVLRLGFYSLLYLAQALGTQFASTAIRLQVIANNVHDVAGEEINYPSRATVVGPARAIPREYPKIQSRCIDIDMNHDPASRNHLVESLLSEVVSTSRDEVVAFRGGHRFTQIFEPFKVEALAQDQTRLREQGVYLITGGLGGLGLVLADYLAASVHAKLALFGRSEFPEKDAWDGWLAGHAEDDRTSRKIMKLRAMEEKGAKVQVFSADVADLEQMRRLVRNVRDNFGPIHGVIHAAGVPGNGMMELKTREIAHEVLSPKVHGTLVLDELLKQEPLDFFVLCSSLTAFFGAAGQSDYTAANAFLDAFAHSRRSQGTAPVSVNWDRWNEVGMAVAALRGELTAQIINQDDSRSTAVYQPVQHPVFVGYSKDGNSGSFIGYLSSSDHWVVGDHRIMGIPILVGTAYLELARAAFTLHSAAETAELRDVVFLAPLMVQGTEKREIEVLLSPSGDRFDFRIRSRVGSSAWQDHAIGKIGPAPAEAPGKQQDIPALLAAFGLDGQSGTDNKPSLFLDEKSLIQAGKRWHSFISVAQKKNEGLAILNLPAEFQPDLNDFRLHPALLDCATAFGLVWITKSGVYLPSMYEGVKIHRALTRKLYCHARFEQAQGGQDELLTLDVDIWDEHGKLLVEVSGYGVKRVPEGVIKRWNQAAEGNSASVNGKKREEKTFDESEVGILSKEGAEVFRRIINLTDTPQVAIASMDLNGILAQMRSIAGEGHLETKGTLAALGVAHPRPDLATPYVAPRTELERNIAEIWQAALGITEVGIYDNFMDLGGDSVMAVQLASRIRQVFEVELSVARFYSIPTVVALAEAIVQIIASQADEETIRLALEEVRSVDEPQAMPAS